MFASGIWDEMDRGVDENEIFRRFCEKEPGRVEEIRLAFDRVGECTERKDYAIPWIEELKADGYRVLYLSNYSNHVMRLSRHALDFLPHMDGGIFSCDVYSVKPERKIYDCLIGKYDLNPAECVFIDDNPKNIRAAEEIGIKGIPFESYEQAHGELMSLLDAYNRTARQTADGTDNK